MRQLISSLITDKKVDPLDILYLNMEYLELNFIKTSEDLHQVFQLFLANSRNSTHKKYLFVDEVQEIDGWEKCINSLRADPTIDVEIFISGSNSKLLSGELATYLS
ncbi:MAG: AAA family ATPase [Patescibacteria group bacterium]|nr:AAA family ATPase [Patescibacteria group bacterium]